MPQAAKMIPRRTKIPRKCFIVVDAAETTREKMNMYEILVEASARILSICAA
jgi:hypothetical protein